MESDFLFRYKYKFKNKKINRIIKLETFIYILFFLLGFILIFYFILNNIENRKLLKQILKNQNKSFLNDTNKLNIKRTDIKNRIDSLKEMTNNNPYIYKHIENCLLNDTDTLLCFYYFIYPKKVIGKNRILVGKKSDGCYVLLDDFENIKIAYSIVLATMIQFDDELAKRGIDVYMYDHKINSLPYNNIKFHWSKIGLCGKNEKAENLKTLEELMKENGHTSEKNMILKMDIEGWEWNSLNELNEDILKQFKYIVMEYHFKDPSKEELYYNVLKKVHKTHQAFYCRCHGRDHISNLTNIISKYFEISYIIREGNKFDKDDAIYPIYELDYSGQENKGKSEINLNVLKLFDFDE